MPAKRRIINRPRRAAFTLEVIELFRTLEATPPRDRKGDEFKRRDRHLARLLGIEHEWFCSIASVTSRERPNPLPRRPAEEDRIKVYAVRLELLAASAAAPTAAV
jgi:hypothetical protein